MKEVKRYQCEYCYQLFLTPNRHSCKHDPKNKNCFTCLYFNGFDIYKGDNSEEDYISIQCEAISYIEDITYKDIDNILGWNAEKLLYLSTLKWNLQCPYWILINRELGKNSFKSFLYELESL